jgi:bifunctional non-homologous end joining protein LigD
LHGGTEWLYEIKFDGYRALAFKTGAKVHLRSRNDNDFNARYPAIAEELASLPDETVVDDKVVALDEAGAPSLNALQNYNSSQAPRLLHVFDGLVPGGMDLTGETLVKRREMGETKVLPKLAEPIRYSPELQASVTELDSIGQSVGAGRPRGEAAG